MEKLNGLKLTKLINIRKGTKNENSINFSIINFKKKQLEKPKQRACNI